MENSYFVRTILNSFVAVDYQTFSDFIKTFELLHPDYVVASRSLELGNHRFSEADYFCVPDGSFAYILTDLDYIPFS